MITKCKGRVKILLKKFPAEIRNIDMLENSEQS